MKCKNHWIYPTYAFPDKALSFQRWSTYINILGSNIPSIRSSLHNIHASTTSPFIKWSIRRYSTSSYERNDYLGNYLCNPNSWVINHDPQTDGTSHMIYESYILWSICNPQGGAFWWFQGINMLNNWQRQISKKKFPIGKISQYSKNSNSKDICVGSKI